MSTDPVKLLVLPYLQHWDASSKTLSLRVLIIPRDSFIVPFVSSNPTSPAFFPNAQLKFNVQVSPLIQELPTLHSGSAIQTVTFQPIASYAQVFNALFSTFGTSINTTNVPRARDPMDTQSKSVRKHLPSTYRDATGYTSGTSNLFTTDDTYSCAMKKVRSKPYKRITKEAFTPSWGELIASILRIPDFASTAGFIRTCEVQIPTDTSKNGGYLWFELDAATESTIGVNDSAPMQTFATLIPALAESRDLFTPVLFSVLASTPDVSMDVIFQEAENYVDGWAKAVHCIQPQRMNVIGDTTAGDSRPARDLGIRLGWDDEQVTVWADRKIDATKKAYDSFPLGVHGYRVDVRDTKLNIWFSLARVEGSYGVTDAIMGQIKSELGVEVHPVTPMDVAEDQSYWIPMYFTNWTQSSLVGMDQDAMTILGRQKPAAGTQQRGVIDPTVQLRYGNTYQFRVRLMDHTGGGPTVASVPSNLGASPVTTIGFRRWIKPLEPIFVGDMPSLGEQSGVEHTPPVGSIEFRRPQMSFPGVVFTGYPDALNKLRSMANDIAAHPPIDIKAIVAEPSLPDPDVDRIEITVLVETLTQDPLATDGTYMEIYTTTRSLPADLNGSVKVDLKWQNCPDIWNPPTAWDASATGGPLLLPQSRTVRLRVNALCRDEPNGPNTYHGAQDIRRGPQLMIPLRKNATNETALFANNTPSYTINGIFLQPDLDTTSRLAAAIGVRSKDTILKAMPGKRVVFACESSLLHLIGPDRGSLSFTAHSDLALQWIIVIRLTMQRDWSWDGLPPDGIRVVRDGKSILSFAPNHNVNSDATSVPVPERSSSQIVILDVINPKLPPERAREQISLKYRIETSFLGSVTITSDAPINLEIDLPVTAAPSQVPQLASAGIVMSSYGHDDAYSMTTPRTKKLWLEFASALEDEQDRYFCRVLKYGPDPLLLGQQYYFPDTEEASIPLDPEQIRCIVPEQSTDFAGLEAMQPLIPTSSPLHWILPLPPGLTDTNPELFGFWTHEFRVGHFNDKAHTRWCTAQGRFGAPLRVAGVQHPPPALVCSLNRDSTRIRVSAQFAQAVQNGNILPQSPQTQMWFILYAQMAQIDGGVVKRNLLIGRKAGNPGERARTKTQAVFSREEVNSMLDMYGLKRNTPLSTLAVEMFRQSDVVKDPLGGDLGRQRILRSSCLVAVPGMC